MMRSIFASRRQSNIPALPGPPASPLSPAGSESSGPGTPNSPNTTTGFGSQSIDDLPLPPQKPQKQENNQRNSNMPRMEVFASKLEDTCRTLLSRFEGVTTWALSVCTVDGKRVALGDFNAQLDGDPPDAQADDNYFPLNELCYLLNYCLASETLGEATLKKYFASRPIPRDRDEFSLHPEGKAWNPLCRTGGLLLSSLLYPEMEQGDRLARIHEYYRKLSVDCSICCDNLSYNLKIVIKNRLSVYND